AGAIASIAAAEQRLRVALVTPDRHIGGMVSGGLGRTDHGKKEVVGGMSREFFERVGRHYHEPITWYFEPHVAEQTFNDWLAETSVQVYRQQPLTRVAAERGRITRMTTAGTLSFTACVFIDCSYEGDLMAAAGVTYMWGREGQRRYGESL